MAYTAPTPADLRIRYPAFAAIADEVIQYWLTDAERYVDETWLEADYAPALMARAAYEMASNGTVTSGSAAIPAGVTSFKSGAFSATVSDAAANASVKGGLQANRYGQEFAALLARNFGGPLLSATGTGPVCGCI